MLYSISSLEIKLSTYQYICGYVREVLYAVHDV